MWLRPAVPQDNTHEARAVLSILPVLGLSYVTWSALLPKVVVQYFKQEAGSLPPSVPTCQLEPALLCSSPELSNLIRTHKRSIGEALNQSTFDGEPSKAQNKRVLYPASEAPWPISTPSASF